MKGYSNGTATMRKGSRTGATVTREPWRSYSTRIWNGNGNAGRVLKGVFFFAWCENSTGDMVEGYGKALEEK